MDRNVEQRYNQQIVAETGEGSALDDVLESTGKVAEVVGESSGEEGNQFTVPKGSKKVGLQAISRRVSDLLFSSHTKSIVLPSVEIQRKKVEISLEKEVQNLVKKVERIQKQRHFSASMLEQTIAQIRYLKRVISELVSMAAKKIEKLYQQYVLKGV